MNKFRSPASREFQRNSPESIGYGYIGIPLNVDREDFIQTCLRRNRVCVITEQGGVFNECYITKQALCEVDFPKELGEKGSFVCYLTSPFYNKPLVIGTLIENDEAGLTNEKAYKLIRINENTTIGIQIDPISKALNIDIESPDPSKIKIQVSGNEESEIEAVSSGNISLITDKEVKIKSYETISNQIVDVEKKDDVYKTVFNKDSFFMNRKNDNGELTLEITDETIRITRKNDNTEQKIELTDENLLIELDRGENRIILSNDNIELSLDGGGEKIELTNGRIHLKTTKDVVINNGGESAVLAETLISMIDQLQSQIALLKNAFQLGSAAAVPMDGGKVAMQVAATSVASIVKLDFSSIKSKVVSLD